MPTHPHIGFFNPTIQLVSSLIIVLASFLIFFMTREFYELSNHKGIRYFRYAFLFFGISFLAQALFPLLLPFIRTIPLDVDDVFPYAFLIMVYAGTMAIFCLLYSVMWKRIKKPLFVALNVVAFLIAVITIFGRFLPFVLLLQVALFIVVIWMSYRESRKKSKSTLILYLLLFFSWIAYVAAHFVLWHLPLLAVGLNILSSILFVVLLYRVLKTVKQ